MANEGGLSTPMWAVTLDDAVVALTWAPDGQRLAVATAAGSVAILDELGHVGENRVRHPAGLTCLTWLGDEVVSGGVDGRVIVGRDIQRVGGYVTALAATSDRLAVAHGRQVTLIDEHCCPPRSSTVANLRWTPDRRSLVMCGFGFVTELELASLHETDVFLRWGGSVESVDWSPRGDWAAAGTRGETNYLWQRPLGAPWEVVPDAGSAMVLPCPSGTGRLVGFDDAGDHLGIGTRGGLAVFDLEGADPVTGPTGRLLPVFCDITALLWWPESPVAVVGASTGDGGGGVLSVRCDSEASPVGVVDLRSAVSCAAWTPQRNFLAVGCVDGQVHLLARDPSWDWRQTSSSWAVTDQW